MPYKGKEYTGNASVRQAFKEDWTLKRHTVTEDQLKHAERGVWIHSAFKDPGPDWNRFEVTDKNGRIIFQIDEEGY